MRTEEEPGIFGHCDVVSALGSWEGKQPESMDKSNNICSSCYVPLASLCAFGNGNKAFLADRLDKAEASTRDRPCHPRVRAHKQL